MIHDLFDKFDAYHVSIWVYGVVAAVILLTNILEMYTRMTRFGVRSVTGVEITTRVALAALWPLILAVWITLAAIVSRLGTKRKGKENDAS